MSNTYKTLYRGQLPSSVATLATVPAGTAWIIKHISMVNAGGTDETCALYRNGTTGPFLFTPPAVSVLAGGMSEFTGTLVLEAGGTIAGVASLATTVTVIIDGDELSVSGSSGVVTRTIGFTIDGGGATITTGAKGSIQIPVAATITGWTILSNDDAVTSGSIVIDIWKDTFANYPPTVADTITAAAKPTLSSATAATSSTLTGWTTSIAAGNILRFNVDSVTTVTRVTVQLTVTT